MKYFLKSSDAAAEKGPFSLESIRESLEKDLIRDTSLVRGEDAAEWTSLRELLKREGEERAARLVRNASEDHAAEQRREGRHGNGQILLGAVLATAGVVLTLAGQEEASRSGGGTYIVFTGLILFGVIQVVRGIARR